MNYLIDMVDEAIYPNSSLLKKFNIPKEYWRLELRDFRKFYWCFSEDDQCIYFAENFPNKLGGPIYWHKSYVHRNAYPIQIKVCLPIKAFVLSDFCTRTCIPYIGFFDNSRYLSYREFFKEEGLK